MSRQGLLDSGSTFLLPLTSSGAVSAPSQRKVRSISHKSSVKKQRKNKKQSNLVGKGRKKTTKKTNTKKAKPKPKKKAGARNKLNVFGAGKKKCSNNKIIKNKKNRKALL